jgi:protein-tyrosine kinase
MSKFFKALEQAQRQRDRRDPKLRFRTATDEMNGHVSVHAVQQEVPTLGAFKSATDTGHISAVMQQHKRARLNRAPSVAAAVPRLTRTAEGRTDPHLVSLLDQTTLGAEQYRTLRYMVEESCDGEVRRRLVAVSSPTPGDGKTMTAINLAGALAQAGDSRVLIVDGDLRHPSVTKLLGVGSVRYPGLVDLILSADAKVADVVQSCPPYNLDVLPAGRATKNSYEVLQSPRLGEIFAEAQRLYSYVIVDTPPLLPFPDCRLISKWVGSFMVVVSAHKTPRHTVEEALHVIHPERLLGLVFNCDDNRTAKYYQYGHKDGDQPVNGERRGWLSRPGQWIGGLWQRNLSPPEPQF